MSHVREHCGTPKITRRWKRLGEGAAWACSCGQLFNLHEVYSYGESVWVWREIESPTRRVEAELAHERYRRAQIAKIHAEWGALTSDQHEQYKLWERLGNVLNDGDQW